MFRSIGLDTDKDLIMTSVVKCRPPGNRPPKPDEVESCHPFLKNQVEAVAPKFIVLLGATSFNRLVPDGDFAEQVGKPFTLKFEGKKYPCLALYHPAYLLYSPRKKKDMREHVALLRALLEREGVVEPSRHAGTPF